MLLRLSAGFIAALPQAVLTDSYKAAHFLQYPEANKMVAYGEFRTPYRGSKETRFVFYGIRHIIENYVNKPWTEEDVNNAANFYKTHNAGKTEFPFPADLFHKFVKENNGYFPIKIEALLEGTVAHNHVPVYQITASKEYSRLVTFLETILTHVWYGTTVATLGARVREMVTKAFAQSVDEKNYGAIDFKLHDFGARGVTCVEQAAIGGAAHLLNFQGTDNLAAAYYVQYGLNDGKPIGESIPATEHSVMTAWRTEREAILNMIEKFGSGTFSCVLDSYDYTNCLDKVIPSIAEQKKKAGGFMVYRPDSGDPTEAVLQGLKAADKTFGSVKNSKGYKVVNKAAVIQGDGINIDNVEKILEAVLKEGYSIECVTFGMGGGLLQKVDRDTMGFATKLSYIEYKDGKTRNIMKVPKTDKRKISLPGILKVKLLNGIPTVYPSSPDDKDPDNLLRTVYDHGPVVGAWKGEDFATIRKRAQVQWLAMPQVHDPLSKEMHTMIDAWLVEFYKQQEEQAKV